MRNLTITEATPRGTNTKTVYSSFVMDDFSILIDRTIDADLATEVILNLRYLNTIDSKREITIYINSPGGSVTDGMAIYDYTRLISNPIRTIGIGLCASMAAFLLSTLSNKRYVTKNCVLLYHQPLINHIGGQTSDIDIVAKRMVIMREKINKMIVEKSNNFTYEQACQMFDRDCWMSAQEALNYGLIDGIMDEERGNNYAYK